MSLPTFETVLYETPAPGVARITQNRPDARNAQNLQLTYDLNAAFDFAAAADDVKVIILAGSDPHFSSGHDLRGGGGKTHADFPVVGTWAEFSTIHLPRSVPGSGASCMIPLTSGAWVIMTIG